MERKQPSTEWKADQDRNQEGNWNVFRIEWKWKHNIPKAMRHNQDISKQQVQSIKCL